MKKVLSAALALVFALSCTVCALAATEYKFGDVTGDGTINSEDALVILNHKVGIAALNEDQLKYADVSGDDAIDALDALLVLEYAVGLVKSFPAENDGAPVGSDIAKIVAYYNNAANASKAYTGAMALDVTEGATTAIVKTNLPSAAVNIAKGLLPNDYPKKTNYSIENGIDTKSGKSIKDILPIKGDAEMSKLDASGVASAQCVEKDGKYEITITLKPETVRSLSKKPAAHASCMEILNITEDDLSSFTMKSCEIKYLGGTIKAVVNSEGLLDSYDVDSPVYITGTVKWSLIQADAELDAKWRQTVNFGY